MKYSHKIIFIFLIYKFNISGMHTHESSSILPSQVREISDELQEVKIDNELDDTTEPLLSKKTEKSIFIPKIDQINKFIFKKLIKHLLPEVSQIVIDYEYTDGVDPRYLCSQTIEYAQEIISLKDNILVTDICTYEILKLNKNIYTTQNTQIGHITQNDNCCCTLLSYFFCSCISNQIHSITCLNDNSFAYCVSDGTIRILSTRNDKIETSQILNKNVCSIMKNPCICIFYCIPTKKISHYLCKHPNFPYCLLQLKNGSLIHCMTNDNTIHVWKFEDNKYYHHQVIDTQHTKGIYNLLELRNGSLTSLSNDKTIKIWALKNGQYYYLQTLDHENHPITKLIQLQDGSLASSSDNFTIKIWQLNDEKYYCSQVLHNENAVMNIIQLNDGSLVSGSLSMINLWKLKDDKYYCFQTINGHTDWVNGLLQLQDGSLVTFSRTTFSDVTNHDSKINIWKPESNGEYSLFQTLEAHTKPIKKVVQLQNGSLASISENNKLKIWHNELSKMQIPEEEYL